MRLQSVVLLLFSTQDRLRDEDASRAAILESLHIGVGDEELIEWGGDPTGDRDASPNPTQCVCGRDWRVASSDQFFPQRPGGAQIAACLAALTVPGSPPCDAPCLAVETFAADWWAVWRNRRTGQFHLYCSKRKQWHCE